MTASRVLATLHRMALTHTRTFTTCAHADGSRIVADILSGDFHGGPGGDQAVQWCRVCGAYRFVFDPFGERRLGEWREPEGPDGDGVRLL